jgi:hypothetical protein
MPEVKFILLMTKVYNLTIIKTTQLNLEIKIADAAL